MYEIILLSLVAMSILALISLVIGVFIDTLEIKRIETDQKIRRRRIRTLAAALCDCDYRIETADIRPDYKN